MSFESNDEKKIKFLKKIIIGLIVVIAVLIAYIVIDNFIDNNFIVIKKFW